jgi:hypothetical protein
MSTSPLRPPAKAASPRSAAPRSATPKSAAATSAGGAPSLLGAVTALEFSRAARSLAEATRRAGWASPTFLSPPRLSGAQRTLRRSGIDSAVVAVRIRDRPWSAVMGDLVEGVVAANRLTGAEAERCRDLLWRSLDEPGERAA